MKDNAAKCSTAPFIDPLSTGDSPPKTVAQLIPRKKNRICFVITKNRNGSWVDDVCACDRLRRGDTVFH